MRIRPAVYLELRKERFMFIVGKDKVIAACNTAIAKIKSDRDQERKEIEEADIKAKMTRFWFPCKTREEAISKFNGGYVYASISMRYGGEERTANSLLSALSVHEGYFVTLDREDAAFVAKWSD